MDGKRVSRGVLVLAAAAAFSFGTITSIATGEHYHVNCNNHGLVHGSSTADSNYHARVEGTPCQEFSFCRANQWGTAVVERYASTGQTCNAHAYGYGPECAGSADVNMYRHIYGHRHYAHNRC